MSDDIGWISDGSFNRYPLLLIYTQVASSIIPNMSKSHKRLPIPLFFPAEFPVSLLLINLIILHSLPYLKPIMSQSQASESQYTASQYANSFINPDLLQSDDFLDAPSSQITAQSTPSSEFPPPSRYPRAPDSLTRVVCKSRQQTYILYKSDKSDRTMDETRKQFVEWWLITEFGAKKELQKSVYWDSNLKKSDVWESFDQVANAKTGEPKVMCKRCQNVIVHPGVNRAGPSPMKAHLTSAVCVKPWKTAKPGINQLLREMVSLS